MTETATGLLVGGRRVTVDGLTILGPGDAPWAFLEPRDRRPRRTSWVRQAIIHTTWGAWPQGAPLTSKPRGGRDRQIAEYWSTSREGRAMSSGAHLVVDDDGSIVCLCDLLHVEAFHATVSNPWSVGIEMFQENRRTDGTWPVNELVYQATTKLVAALCYGKSARYDSGEPWPGLGIPFQIPADEYRNAPLVCLRSGGPDVAGVFGHRHNTTDRGRGDPGDEVFSRLHAAGAEKLLFSTREDIAVWKRRQARLNDLAARDGKGPTLVVDGVFGPRTRDAMRARGLDLGTALDALAA